MQTGFDIPQKSLARCASVRLRLLLLAAVLTVAAWGIYAEFVQPNLAPRNFGVVKEGEIYRSGRMTPAALERLVKDKQIRTVIDLGAFDKDPSQERMMANTAQALGIKRFSFKLEGDGTGNPNAYVAALRVLADPSSHPVLVHCSAGAQRTSACIMLYRNIIEHQPFGDAFKEALAHEHDPGKNTKLGPYLLDWAPKIQRAFEAGEGGWIPGLPTFDDQFKTPASPNG